MQALRLVRSKLESALDEYAQACLRLADRPGSGLAPHSLQDVSDDVNAELDAFTSIKDKTRRIEATLGKVRNSLLSAVPINALPDEVLVRIFHLVMKAHSSSFEKLVDADMLPLKTPAIAQVCARWRQASLGSKGLWSYINLSVDDEVVALGKHFATRSGDQPLSIRIVEPIKRWHISTPYDEFYDLIAMVGPRMESLEFDLVPPPPHIELSPLWFDILQYCLCRATEKLMQLTISCRKDFMDPKQYYDSAAHWFLVPDNGDDVGPDASDTGLTVVMDDIPERHYEDILLNIQSLYLSRVYPIWTSKAYHGLVELRLDGPPLLTAIITANQLAGILTASPRMRVLNLGIEIIPTRALPPAVRLEELEVFLLQSLTEASQQAILRLILPGSKPLQMSTTYGEAMSELPDANEDEFTRFFRRSNIVQLQVHSTTRVLPELLLGLLPNIQVLIFREAVVLADDTSGGFPSPRLSVLHFVSCTISLASLIWLVSRQTVREVTMWECKIMDDEGDERSAVDFIPQLMEVCPVIRFLGKFDYSYLVKVEGWGEDIQTRMKNAQKSDYAVA